MSLIKVLNYCIHYLQWDKKWKNIKYSTHTSKQTIGNSGCGPTAVAMIIATFCDPSITPVEVCKWSVENGYRSKDSGTYWGLFTWVFKHFTFAKYKTTSDIGVLKAALDEGALAVGSMNGNADHFWTTQGHFITIVGYDSDGYIYANDPNKAECPRKQHEKDFKKCLKKAFIYWPDKSSYDPDTLRMGNKGDKVKAMQNLLLKWKPDCLPKFGADSDFGSETYNALVQFQKSVGLEASGVYDKATRDALTGWKPDPTPTPDPDPSEYRKATETSEPDKIWNYLMNKINNPYGVAGLMGNLRAESALRSCNLQQTYETKLGYTDATYTKAVDDGSYSNFTSDQAGYGLAQWTSSGRKKNLLAYVKETNSSIGNLDMQLEFLIHELSGSYKQVLSVLKNATSVREASDVVLLKFEIPANRGEAVQEKRASYGTEYYNKYTGSGSDADVVLLKKGSKGDDVKDLQRMLIEAGYSLQPYGVDGSYGSVTEKAVKQLQLDNGLPGTGKYDLKTQNILLSITGARVVVVLGGTVNTRLSPVDGKVYKVVKRGDKLPYVSTDKATGWYLVFVDGTQVWITNNTKYTKLERV